MRPEKNLLREEIQNELVKSKAFLIAGYQKFNPEMSWKMTGRLKKCNSHFGIVKKRVLFKAIKEAKLPIDLPKVSGHVGVLFLHEDPLVGIKSFFELNEEWNQNFQIQQALYDGQTYNASEIETLAKLPSLPVLRAQFLGVLVSPMVQFVGVIQSLLTSIPYGLENKIKKN